MLRTASLLLLFAGSAAAQTTDPGPIAGPAIAAPGPRTAADTVQAIRRLYARHRRIGGIMTAGAVGADVVLAGISAANENAGYSHGSGGYGGLISGPLLQFGFGGYALFYTVLLTPVLVPGIQQLIAYGPRHEAKVIAEYEANHQLPAKVTRKLGRYLR